MAYYRKCPLCGANLDPGEQCDCAAFLQEGKQGETAVETQGITGEQSQPEENKKARLPGACLFAFAHPRMKRERVVLG